MVDAGPVGEWAFAPAPKLDLTSSGGWCAPSDSVYVDLFDPVRIHEWPAGLLPEDIEWLARMIQLAEIDPDPVRLIDLEGLPAFQVRRGGLRWPAPEEG